ncbi:MAG: hypothetical protein JWP11_2571 [Frankiales bacterium]|jgi:hypothetical protein|nr:hypothetical protein [Frankiales bacterium]
MFRSVVRSSTPSGTAKRAARPLAKGARGLTWVAGAAVLAIPFASPGGPISLVHVALEQPVPLHISGSVSGLRHGLPAVLALTLRSRSDAEVIVSSVTARATGASAGCPVGALSIGAWTGRLAVPAHGNAAAAIPVVLHDATGACAGATWQLAYTSS